MGTGRQVSPNPAVIGFFAGESPDDCGRYLDAIQNWPDIRLEAVHDYIQWLFPLTEASPVNPSAPVLDEATIQEVRQRPELRESLRRSFLRMLTFYGLEVHGGEVRGAANFASRSSNWLTFGNHNHLRVTRILKSLSLLGLEPEAQAFYRQLVKLAQRHAEVISARTLRFWITAAHLEK